VSLLSRFFLQGNCSGWKISPLRRRCPGCYGSPFKETVLVAVVTVYTLRRRLHLTEMSSRSRKIIFPGSRARPARRAGKLAAICEPIV
jgi:hypothetical protein